MKMVLCGKKWDLTMNIMFPGQKRIKVRLIKYYRLIPIFPSYYIFASFLAYISPLLVEMGNSLNRSPAELNLVFAYYMIGGLTGRISVLFLRRRISNLNLTLTSYLILLTAYGATILEKNKGTNTIILISITGIGIAVNPYIVRAVVRINIMLSAFISVFTMLIVLLILIAMIFISSREDIKGKQ